MNTLTYSGGILLAIASGKSPIASFISLIYIKSGAEPVTLPLVVMTSTHEVSIGKTK